jgi:transcriptional regulator with XRE-family HTH domain
MPPSKIPNPKNLPEKLRRIRTDAGLTLRELMRALGFGEAQGIYTTTICAYESGKSAPPLPVLLAYARAGGTSVDYLIDDHAKPPRLSRKAAAGKAATAGRVKEKEGSKVAAIEKESRKFTCPACNADFHFLLQVRVVGVRESEEGEGPETYARRPPAPQAAKGSGLTDQEERLVEQYRESGTLAAFEEAMTTADGASPKNPGKTFINWLKQAKPSMVPRLAMQQLAYTLNTPAREITVYTYQSVTAIISRNKVRCFIPTRLLKGELLAASGGSSLRLRVDPGQDAVSKWVGTKGGAALAGGDFLKELQAVGATTRGRK